MALREQVEEILEAEREKARAARAAHRQAAEAQIKVAAKALTGRQRAWADAWLDTGNATEAARRAGYKGNDNAMARIGHTNRRNAKIEAYVSAVCDLDPLVLSPGETMRLLTRIALGEPQSDRATSSGIVRCGPTMSERLKALEMLEKRRAVALAEEALGAGGAPERIIVEFGP